MTVVKIGTDHSYTRKKKLNIFTKTFEQKMKIEASKALVNSCFFTSTSNKIRNIRSPPYTHY